MIQPIGWKRIAALRWRLIPDATNTEAVTLIVVAAVYSGIDVAQFAEPSEVRIVLCTTPPVAAGANGAVCSRVVAVTAREARKSALIGGASVGGIPTRGGFHFASCNTTSS